MDYLNKMKVPRVPKGLTVVKACGTDILIKYYKYDTDMVVHDFTEQQQGNYKT